MATTSHLNALKQLPFKLYSQLIPVVKIGKSCLLSGIWVVV